jgi:Cof subfamily protein (haloacid dehalogenase superfamily)
MNQHKEIKLIAVDVDGTLLNSQAELSGRAEAALRKAIAQGVLIVLATGKTRNSTLRFIEKLALNAPGIYLQGLMIYDGDGTIKWQQTLNAALARQIITFAEDRGFTVVAYNGTRIMVRAVTDLVTDMMVKYHEPVPDAVGSLQNILNDIPIHKLMILGEPRAIKSLRWNLNLQVGTVGRVVQAGLPQMLEVLPPNCSKGAALRILLKELRISPDNVLAIGDAENDIEMIQLAGIGVAMDHAGQPVKDAADYVVASNDDDGFAEAVERFVLPPETSVSEAPATEPAQNGIPATGEPKPAASETPAAQPKTTESTP